MRHRHKLVEKINSIVTFKAGKDFVEMEISFGGQKRYGVRFKSPEELLLVFNSLLEEAVKVWPDNEWIKMYLESEN